MEGSERLLLVRVPDFNVSAAIDTVSPSCFNAFSRVDVRVDVKIPGGVHAYVIDLRGERCALPLGRVWLSAKRSIGTMPPQKSGRKHISPLFFALSCTRMIRRTGSNVIGKWTPLLPRRAS